MTRLLFAGKHTWSAQPVDRPFTLSLTDKVLRFNDYDTVHNENLMLVYAVPMLNIFAPTYRVGHDNSQQRYEMLDWTASDGWYETRIGQWHFSHAHLQTWDRQTFFLWAKWPHRRYNNRMWPIEFTAEQAIFKFDLASRVRMLRFMDSIKKQQEHSHA